MGHPFCIAILGKFKKLHLLVLADSNPVSGQKKLVVYSFILSITVLPSHDYDCEGGATAEMVGQYLCAFLCNVI